MRMRLHRHLELFVALFFCIFAGSLFAAVTQSMTYSVITRYGPVQELMRATGSNETLVESADGRNAYLVRSVQVRDEAHLLQLMGGDEAG